MGAVSIHVNKRLELSVYSVNARQEFTMRLSRIEAQELARCLLEYAGAAGLKGFIPGDKESFAAMDLTPIPKEFQPKKAGPPILLSKRGSIRLR